MQLRITTARLVRVVGWAGVAGFALMLAALMALAMYRPVAPLAQSGAPASVDEVAAVAARVPGMVLPPADDVPLLMTRIQRSAVAHGLGWPRADYRLNPATDESPASLDLRCVLKGPYPKVRAFVTDVLLDVPTLTLREFNLSRPTSETVDVEAKLSMVIYLGGGRVK